VAGSSAGLLVRAAARARIHTTVSAGQAGGLRCLVRRHRGRLCGGLAVPPLAAGLGQGCQHRSCAGRRRVPAWLIGPGQAMGFMQGWAPTPRDDTMMSPLVPRYPGRYLVEDYERLRLLPEEAGPVAGLAETPGTFSYKGKRPGDRRGHPRMSPVSPPMTGRSKPLLRAHRAELRDTAAIDERITADIRRYGRLPHRGRADLLPTRMASASTRYGRGGQPVTAHPQAAGPGTRVGPAAADRHPPTPRSTATRTGTRLIIHVHRQLRARC